MKMILIDDDDNNDDDNDDDEVKNLDNTNNVDFDLPTPRFNEINGVMVATILMVWFHMSVLFLSFAFMLEKQDKGTGSERNGKNQNNQVV